MNQTTTPKFDAGIPVTYVEGDGGKVDFQKLIAVGRMLLEAIGEDPDRSGLADTPERFAKHWRAFAEYNPGKIETVFPLEDATGLSDDDEDKRTSGNEMIVVSGMRVWSMCEHHLLPFFADVNVAYISRDTIIGLSKFARIAHKYAHRLQVQERLVRNIRDEVARVTGSPDVAVLATGEHLCMTMRGVRTPARMTSSALSGAFRDDRGTKMEFLELIKR